MDIAIIKLISGETIIGRLNTQLLDVIGSVSVRVEKPLALVFHPAPNGAGGMGMGLAPWLPAEEVQLNVSAICAVASPPGELESGYRQATSGIVTAPLRTAPLHGIKN